MSDKRLIAGEERFWNIVEDALEGQVHEYKQQAEMWKGRALAEAYTRLAGESQATLESIKFQRRFGTQQ